MQGQRRVQETMQVDESQLARKPDVSATVSQTSCSGGEQQCLLVELQFLQRCHQHTIRYLVDWDYCTPVLLSNYVDFDKPTKSISSLAHPAKPILCR